MPESPKPPLPLPRPRRRQERGAPPMEPTPDTPPPIHSPSVRLLAPPALAPSSAAHYVAGLRALGLLDFVHLDLPSSSGGAPRPDLVAALILDPGSSSVRGASIDVSLDAFAKALRLPRGRPATGRPPAGVNLAAVTSAATAFMQACILAPLEAASDRKRRLPPMVDAVLGFVNSGHAHIVDWAELIWGLVKTEMEQLAEGKRADSACYYGAYLQRLIWVERPDLFQLPPEAAPPKPAALRFDERAKQLDALAEPDVEQDREELRDYIRSMESLNETLLFKE